MNVLPMVNKGLTLFQWKQDIEAAEKCCQEALEIDPECEAAVATLAQLTLQQGKIDIAIKMFDRQTALARSEPELISALTYQYVSTDSWPIQRRHNPGALSNTSKHCFIFVVCMTLTISYFLGHRGSSAVHARVPRHGCSTRADG